MKLSEFLKEHKVDEVNLSNIMLCKDCSKVFVWHDGERFVDNPQHCPACADKIQLRPSIVQERVEKARFDRVEIKSLPGAWSVVEAKVKTDYPCYKISKKGADFGASWSGRIDIFADAPYDIGNIVNVRVMASKHLVKIKRIQVGHIQKSPFDEPTHLVERTVDINSPDEESMTTEIETREYIVLEEIAEVVAPQYSLVWATAYTKTTIKGYGRQYHADLDASITLWSASCSGGVRSGRAGSEGVLAIVNEEHPLIYKFREGGEETISYIK